MPTPIEHPSRAWRRAGSPNLTPPREHPSVQWRRNLRRAIPAVAIVATVAVTGCAGQSQGPEIPENPPAPYCMVDREIPDHLTVAGPAGGWITVDGEPYKALTLVTGDYADEVAPDAAPYNGILYNVPGGDVVSVDGWKCETT